MQEIYKKLPAADGMIIGSPVCVGNVTAQLKAMMGRCRALGREASRDMKPKSLRLKVGAAIAVAPSRHTGQENVFHAIRSFFSHVDVLPVGMTAPHTPLGATGIAHKIGSVETDKWFHWNIGREIPSLDMARMLGKRVFVLASIVKAGIEVTGLDFPRPYSLDF